MPGNLDMKLSVHLVTGGKYIRAGDPLPAGFELPPHLETFVIDPPQTSRAASRLSTVERQGVFGTGGQPAKPAMGYREGKEEFIPKTRGTKMGEEIRRAHQERKRRL